MKEPCDRIQQRLAEDGPAALRDDAAAQAHVAECADCYGVLGALADLDATAPLLADEAVSRELAAATVGGVAADDRGLRHVTMPPWPSRLRRWAPRLVVAASFAAVALLLVASSLLNGRQSLESASRSDRYVEILVEKPERGRAKQVEGKASNRRPPADPAPPAAAREAARGPGSSALGDEAGARADDAKAFRKGRPSAGFVVPNMDDEALAAEQRRQLDVVGDVRGPAEADAEPEEAAAALKVLGYLDGLSDRADKRDADESVPSLGVRIVQGSQQRANERFRQDGNEALAELDAVTEAEASTLTDDLQHAAGGKDKKKEALVEPRAERLTSLGYATSSPAAHYLAELAALDDLRFQDPTGYWSNTYVPGDPLVRRLQRRLARDRGELLTPSGLPPEELVSASAQPFDPPRGAALAAYLHADHAAVDGPSRVLLQVGLQATTRANGRRPAMTLAVVLDHREAYAPPDLYRIRALLEALASARQPGDRIGLSVAGSTADAHIPIGELRYGTVQLALTALAEERIQGGTSLGLALNEAVAGVSSADDPAAPIGSSAVLLVSPFDLSAHADALAWTAHQAAVRGVTVTAVGVGDAPDVASLDEVALAGQGSRRLLQDPTTAGDLVRAELAAVSEVVARAVRLRIRLAPGVQLVDVVGSERLDTVAADRVREAERSIDQRLSKSLGIQADRGEDTEGIQIVIPAFYSGDSHVVLLDVVVPGAGPVADLSVRYKDLVQLDNGVARDSLRLRRGERPPGPLQTRVLANRVSHDVAEGLKGAGALLRAGEHETARDLLTVVIALLEDLGELVPALATLPDLRTDLDALRTYLALVDGIDAGRRDHLGDALLYSGHRKAGLQPPQEP